jgi:hypothetical protein
MTRDPLSGGDDGYGMVSECETRHGLAPRIDTLILLQGRSLQKYLHVLQAKACT